ncbi:hypothetical protein [Tellurirhabdus rosea]|uniref:hypothetical protein n=1 Tax=Tellurirhabdus rosea TaxID=2674997 RepID=UPI0022582093|nr:hypothetical protein [Tellurirhabdus rosea]
MRKYNKYIEKVQEEMSVFQKHMLDGTELTPTQQATFEKMNIARGWLKDGYADTDVIQLLKNDPSTKLQDRRAREVLAMTYQVFAELRQSRDKHGIKMLYAEMFREAAQQALEAGDYMSFSALLDKAAKIDGAYDKEAEADIEQKKKPTKVTFKKVVNVTNNYGAQKEEPRQIEDISHESAE